MWLLPSGLMLLLGAWGIRRQGAVWRDEAVTYDMAHRGLADLWATLQHVDVVHGVYYALMHVWFRLYDATLGGAFGGALDGVFGAAVGLRLPSVAAMTAAAAGVALLGRRLVGPRAGLLAGLVFALIPLVQQYAQEGRSYAAVCALVIWAGYVLVRAAARPRRRLWAAYTALMLCACLLHEFACLALPAHGAAVVLARLPRRVLRAWALCAAAVFAGLAPLAVYSTRQSAQLSWLLWPDPGQLLTFAALAALGLACAHVCVRARVSSRGPIGLRALAVPLLLLPTLLLFLLSHLEPAYVDRYVLYYVAGFALLAGAALARLLRPAGEHGQTRARRLRRTLAVALALAALLPVTVRLRSPDSRVDDVTAVARAVRETAEPGDGLLFMPSRRRIWMATRPDDFRGLDDLALAQSPVASHTLYGTEVSGDAIRDRMLAARRIIVAGDPADQPTDDTDQEIAKRATLRDAFEACGSREVRGARVTVYARPGACGVARTGDRAG
ncbi:glycosyltransferase family 39 protein [Streptomyces sp. NPDC001339]|uniref:glycosyltransferase family 39 protein n=1 Tax=Streptomyces sp. NPDC001339 TaxID=3364563 RepID=UPI0036A3B6E5